MLADYHVHVHRGERTLEWLQRFVDAGTERGVSELGISEHSYYFAECVPILDSPWSRRHVRGSMAGYCAFIERAKAAGLPVKLGLEMDYIPGKEAETRAVVEAYPFDFVIGSVHWLDGWGFDWVGDEACMAEWRSRDTYEVFAQ